MLAPDTTSCSQLITIYHFSFDYWLKDFSMDYIQEYSLCIYDTKHREKTPEKCRMSCYILYVFYLFCLQLYLFLIYHPQYLGKPMNSVILVDFIQTTSFSCCDFIAQLILIYRCWIVWGRNIRVVIIPSILALAFLATWLASNDSDYAVSHQLVSGWVLALLLSSLTLSLTVNAFVTGLIVFRIFKVFREVRATSQDQILGATGGSKLWRMIFILIESGMALFSIQFARLVVTIVWPTEPLNIIGGIHEMLTGITPTIIVVRTSMGLSFDDKTSMEEFAIESLRFASNHPNSVGETGSIAIVVDEHSGDDDDIGVHRSKDIEVVER